MQVEIMTMTEFLQLHPGPRVDTPDPNTWLLSDGASYRVGLNGPEFFEPSSDPLECLKARKDYHLARLERVQLAFGNLKAALLGQGPPFRWQTDFGAAPPAEQDALLHLKDMVVRHRDALAEIEAEIQAHPTTVAAAKRAEYAAQQQQLHQNREFQRQNTISAINI